MTDLSDPAIREAGARALFTLAAAPAFTWNELPDVHRDKWLGDWDAIADELNPIIQMVAIQEQLRAGDDPGSEPDNTNPDPASPDNAVQEGEE